MKSWRSWAYVGAIAVAGGIADLLVPSAGMWPLVVVSIVALPATILGLPLLILLTYIWSRCISVELSVTLLAPLTAFLIYAGCGIVQVLIYRIYRPHQKSQRKYEIIGDD